MREQMTADEWEDAWSDVAGALTEAKCIAWDGCHKIYIALDDEQAEFFENNYPHVVRDTPEVMNRTINEWYDHSCGLRFVESVTTTPDPNDGYEWLIPQFFADDDDEEA